MNKYIKLHCHDCDYVECKICPIGTYITEESQKGCIREVPEELYIKYYNNMNELLPFLNSYKYDVATKFYNSIIEDNYKIYNYPIKKIISQNGKLSDFLDKELINK